MVVECEKMEGKGRAEDDVEQNRTEARRGWGGAHVDLSVVGYNTVDHFYPERE